jgi:hypothetical protein
VFASTSSGLQSAFHCLLLGCRAGRLLWCLPPASQAARVAEPPLLVESELASFRCILLHLDMINHHLPSFHFGVLRLLLAAKNAAGAENGHDRNSDNVHVERGSPEALVCNASGVCSLSQEIEG